MAAASPVLQTLLHVFSRPRDKIDSLLEPLQAMDLHEIAIASVKSKQEQRSGEVVQQGLELEQKS